MNNFYRTGQSFCELGAVGYTSSSDENNEETKKMSTTYSVITVGLNAEFSRLDTNASEFSFAMSNLNHQRLELSEVLAKKKTLRS